MTSEIENPRIGVDLGGTKIETIVLDGHGDIPIRRRAATPKNDYQAIVSAIANLITETENEAGIGHSLPIGIGTPGAISLKTGKMKNCNSTCLNGMPLREDLEQALGRPVRIANDADCLTLSEASDGAAAGARSVFGVILGTGVGGGICFNGTLLSGSNAICGEWGHNTLPLSAYKPSPEEALVLERPRSGTRTCFCGRNDCVETFLAGPGLERSYLDHTGKAITAPAIEQLATDGDTVATALMTQYCNLLALALSNVINILDPDTIVLGGGMSNADLLYGKTTQFLPQYVFSDQVNTRIVKAMHGDSSGVRGAAWLWSLAETGGGGS